MLKPDLTIKVFFGPKLNLNGDKCLGICRQNGDTYTIQIDKSLPFIAKLGVFFHELTHAVILWAFGDQRLTEEVEEKTCNKVEAQATRFKEDDYGGENIRTF